MAESQELSLVFKQILDQADYLAEDLLNKIRTSNA